MNLQDRLFSNTRETEDYTAGNCEGKKNGESVGIKGKVAMDLMRLLQMNYVGTFVKLLKDIMAEKWGSG